MTARFSNYCQITDAEDNKEKHDCLAWFGKFKVQTSTMFIVVSVVPGEGNE